MVGGGGAARDAAETQQRRRDDTGTPVEVAGAVVIATRATSHLHRVFSSSSS